MFLRALKVYIGTGLRYVAHWSPVVCYYVNANACKTHARVMYHRLLFCIVCCGLHILTRKKRKGTLTWNNRYVSNVYIDGDDVHLINVIILLM